MDFLILTAFISGIFGQFTQVNYASGKTYKDYVAIYRVARGEKADSLVLKLSLIDRLLKNKLELEERPSSTSHFMPLSQPEVIAVSNHYCNPGLKLSSPGDAQPIHGVQSPEVLRTQGIVLPQSMQESL